MEEKIDKQYKLTIVTIVFNNVTEIETTILSVLQQKFRNIEYIIIDGGSTDGTVEIIKKYSSFITYWISESDDGIYNAMNKGIKIATGEWIMFLNAGDYLYSHNTLESIFQTSYKNVDVIYGDICFVYPNAEKIKKSDKNLSNFHRYLPIFHPSTFVKTSIMKRYMYDENYKIAADYKFLYSLYRNKYVFQKVDIIVSYFDINGISNKNKLLAMKENFKVRSLEKKHIWIPKFLLYSIYHFLKNLNQNHLKKAMFI